MLMNRKFVDEFAVEFCLSMNNKGTRRRLVQALFTVDKNRWAGQEHKWAGLLACELPKVLTNSWLLSHNVILVLNPMFP